MDRLRVQLESHPTRLIAVEAVKLAASHPDNSTDLVRAVSKTYPEVFAIEVHGKPVFMQLASGPYATLEILVDSFLTSRVLFLRVNDLKQCISQRNLQTLDTLLAKLPTTTYEAPKHFLSLRNSYEVDRDSLIDQVRSIPLPKANERKLAIPTNILKSLIHLTESEQAITQVYLAEIVLEVLQRFLAPDWHSNIGRWVKGGLDSELPPIRKLCVRASAYFGRQALQACIVKAPTKKFLYLDCLIAHASIASGDALNLILLKMLDLLQDKPFLGAHGFRVAAHNRSTTPYQLCAPYWSTLALTAVRRRSTILDKFVKILEVNKVSFVSRTTPYILPYLCLAGETGSALWIAEALGMNPPSMYINHAPSIIAQFLVQETTDPMAYAEQRFCELHAAFGQIGFSRILGVDKTPIIFEVLKLVPQNQDLKRKRIIDMLKNEFAGYVTRSHVFKLVLHFSHAMRSLQGRQQVATKLQCLHGLEAMMELCASELPGAIRQISAFLLSALDEPELVEGALRAWRAMVIHLDDNVSEIVDLSFALVSDLYPSLEPESQNLSFEIVENLLQREATKRHIMEHGSPKVPFTELQVLIAKIEGKRRPMKRLHEAVIRGDKENTFLVKQMLSEVCEILEECQGEVSQWMADFEGRSVLSETLTALRSLSGKSNFETKGRELLSRAKGLLGALDPHIIEPSPISGPPVFTSLLDTRTECAQFISILVTRYLLPAFEAAVDPTLQTYIAYGIQELLKVAGYGTDTLETQSERFFAEYPGELGQAVAPFLQTMYVMKSDSVPNASYPILQPGISYSRWLAELSYDQMFRVGSENERKIFGLCRLAVREEFSDILEWLLPYAALSAVTASNENQEAFLTEVHAVLAYTGAPAFHILIFQVLDYFGSWLRNARAAPHKTALHASRRVERLLEEISPAVMAKRAREANDPARVIRYWEQAVERPTETWGDLREMYAALHDTDSLEGLSAKWTVPLNPLYQVLEHRAMGDWEAALACYSALGQWNSAERIECLLKSGRDKDALAQAERAPNLFDVADGAVDCAISAGDWGALSRWVRLAREPWLGQALLALKDQNSERFNVLVSHARSCLIGQSRSTTLKLHALEDLNLFTHMAPENLRVCLDSRLSCVGNDIEDRRWLLSLRRAAFSAVFPDEASNEAQVTWNLISKDARNVNQPIRALTAVLRAESPEEYAQLLWQQGEPRKAIKTLERTIPKSKRKQLPPDAASKLLQLTIWLEQAGQVPSSELIKGYTNTAKLAPHWEEAEYRLGKHYAKLLDTQNALPESERAIQAVDGSWNKYVVRAYTQSLLCGIEHVEETLPKLIGLWLDIGPQGKRNMAHIGENIRQWASKVPAYVLYLGLPQLLSRLGHSSQNAYEVLEKLVRKAADAYPRQALWPLLEVMRAKEHVRQARGRAIFLALTGEAGEIKDEAAKFVERLRHLCSRSVPSGPLFRLEDPSLRGSVPCRLAVPVQSVMTCTLPNPQHHSSTFRALPRDPTMWKIDPVLAIQHSLQRPRRMAVYGSDGLRYLLLLKGKDDLRKDARLIDFTTTANRMLSLDPQASQRHLSIPTFRVTPIDDSSGIIEWVEGAVPIRKIVEGLHKAHGITCRFSEWKGPLSQSRPITERETSYHQALNKYPAVLQEWYMAQFPDPRQWLKARARYARSLAVMSIVGYIVGLGDRHLENLLVIEATGEVLHVDFDCLFDKGESFKYPERVPFRLTQNLVAALGITGYEGQFRRACEISLGLLRSNEDLFMTVLESFLYDPVVGTANTAAKILDVIRRKIRGIRNRDSAPLSVDGQVEHLITEAVSPRNLCQMYIGWAPFL